MNNRYIKTDGFRFIDNLHTTARQLPVFTAIVRTLGNKQLTKNVLERLLIDWSISEENNNSTYKQSKGKITNNGEKTGALRYHIELSPSLGLTHRFNVTYQNTKISKIFLQFINGELIERILAEKIFYLYQLLILDADGIILLISELIGKREKSQKKLQDNFKQALNDRLLLKKELSSQNVSSVIAEKYRIINFIWKNAGKYAEHIIAPRYEWLSYLHLVDINRNKNTTLYSLTEEGEIFYNCLPNLTKHNNLRDINYDWLNGNFFTLLNITYPNNERITFESMPQDKQDKELSESLQKARKAVQSSIAFKLPLREALLFISMNLFIEKNIVINFSSILNKLKSGFIFNNRKYLLRVIGNENQGYITVTIIE